jgi:hypothetical protein
MTAKSDRRKFLRQAAKAVAPFSVIAEETTSPGEKVRFLTADGELIEIDRQLVEQLTQSSAKGTSNAEILKWTNQVKTKPKTDE